MLLQPSKAQIPKRAKIENIPSGGLSKNSVKSCEGRVPIRVYLKTSVVSQAHTQGQVLGVATSFLNRNFMT